MKKRLIVIGAGPAGLSAAYEILEKSGDWDVTILEASPFIGGISRTIERNGNRFDIGPHRFFSKSDEVNALWDKLMPRQGVPAKDDVLLNRRCSLAEGGREQLVVQPSDIEVCCCDTGNLAICFAER